LLFFEKSLYLISILSIMIFQRKAKGPMKIMKIITQKVAHSYYAKQKVAAT